MLKIAVAIVGLLWSGIAIGHGADLATPALLGYAGGVKDAAHTRDLTLKRLSILVAERGAIAETTVEASFLNKSGEMLEGDSRFRLPPDAVLTGFALDEKGRMTDGVLVDRQRAKAVYDARVRVRVDAAVAAIAPDNLLHVQVNAILPSRTRTIRLRFAMPVSPAGYRLPIAAPAPPSDWQERPPPPANASQLKLRRITSS